MIETVSQFLSRGGPALWAIAALSVITLALILWKIWRLSLSGVWVGGRAEAAVAQWMSGHRDDAKSMLKGRRSARAIVTLTAMSSVALYDNDTAREETARVARATLRDARQGLRALELIMTIAPLIGLLGTVLGMIEAFQALQDSGSRTDPSALAGGIWEALLTTAAGMAVAIPAGIALSWFESVADRLAHDLEDIATRVFAHKA